MSQQINLYNPLFRKRRAGFDASAMGFALLGLLAVLLALDGYARHRVGAAADQAAAAKRNLAADQAQVAKLTAELAARGTSKLLEDQLKQAEAELGARRRLKAAFESSALGSTEGFSRYMRAFARRAVDGLWITGFTLEGASAIALSGRVLEPDLVPRYLARLAEEPLLKGARFGALQLSRPAPAKAEAAGAPAAAPRWVEFELSAPLPAPVAATGAGKPAAAGAGR